MFVTREKQICAACIRFYRYTMVFVPGGVMVFALVVLATLIPITVGKIAKGDQLMIRPNDVIKNISR